MSTWGNGEVPDHCHLGHEFGPCKGRGVMATVRLRGDAGRISATSAGRMLWGRSIDLRSTATAIRSTEPARAFGSMLSIECDLGSAGEHRVVELDGGGLCPGRDVEGGLRIDA